MSKTKENLTKEQLNLLLNTLKEKWEKKSKIKATLIYCPFCNSIKTEFYNLKQEQNNHIAMDNYDIKCNDCGATRNINEVWSKGEINYEN